MRFLLFEARDNAGGPFAVVVRQGEEPPSWPGLILAKLGEYDRLESLLGEIEERGLTHTAPSSAALPEELNPASPAAAPPAAGGGGPERAR